MEGLTAGFGMGPGVPPPLWLPENSLGAVARADTLLYANSSGAPKIYNLDSFSIWRPWKYFCSRRVRLGTLPRAKSDFRLVRYLTVLQIRIELPILKFSDLFQAIINLLTVESGGFNSGRFCFAARQSGGLRGECTLWYMTRASVGFNDATEQNQLNFS